MDVVDILSFELEILGYKTRVVRSHTNFGISFYLYVTLVKNDYVTEDNSVKFRFSDHSVTNIHRVFNEYHYGINTPFSDELFDMVLFQVRFQLETSKYFDKTDDFIEENKFVETSKPNDTDEVISYYYSEKKGRIIYKVKRIRYIPAFRYTYRLDGRFLLFKK